MVPVITDTKLSEKLVGLFNWAFSSHSSLIWKRQHYPWRLLIYSRHSWLLSSKCSNRVSDRRRLCKLNTEVKREMFCKKNLLISDLLNRILPKFVNWYPFLITFICKLSKGSSVRNGNVLNVLQEAVNSLLKEINSLKKGWGKKLCKGFSHLEQ